MAENQGCWAACGVFMSALLATVSTSTAVQGPLQAPLMNRGRRASVYLMRVRQAIGAAIIAAVACAAGTASAQQTSADAPPPAQVITTAPGESPTSQAAWYQQDLEDAKARSKSARNALIGTSAAFAVGVIIAGIGASQCDNIPSATQPDQWVCNRTGDVMVPLGGTIAGLSAVGMITSGIILGVSNKRKREIQRDMRRSGYGARPHWDIPSGRFVF